MAKESITSKKQSARKLERLLGIIAIATIVGAWILGFLQVKADILPSLHEALPQASRFELVNRDTHAAWAKKGSGDVLLGYVAIHASVGYGGPVSVAVASDTEGNIIGVSIVDHKETPTFFSRVLKSDVLSSFSGKSYKDPLILGQDVDTVSGATRSMSAINESLRQGIRSIAKKQLKLSVPEEQKVRIQFGLPEIILLVLFGLGILIRLKGFKPKKAARWVSLLGGLIFIGFVYNSPLTISMINQVLLGFWPQWQTNLFWFILMSGIAIIFVLDKKNPYCGWFCPFGAAQECMGFIGKAKSRSPGPYRNWLEWLQRLLACTAIVIALLYRNPGLSSYEVFGTLFDLVGSTFQLILLGIVLITSLFILRPWCNYLCPIPPVEEFFRMLRRWMSDSWQRKKA